MTKQPHLTGLSEASEVSEHVKAPKAMSKTGRLDNLLNSLDWLSGLSPTELKRLSLRGLDLCAEAGDRKARHAASVIRAPQCAGRKAIDDTETLRRIQELVAAGKPSCAVVSIVAARMAPDERQQYAIAQRLRRKLRKMHKI